MQQLTDILAYTLPSLIVLGCVYVVMMKFYRNESEKRLWELKLQSQKEITSTRLRAYERLALLLERTQPERMLVDLTISEMSVLDVQRSLLMKIRQEFDHNMSQQIYVSDELWEKMMVVREQSMAFVNAMATQLPTEATALDYAKVLMTAYDQNGVTPHEVALETLKKEAREIQ